MSVDEEHSLSQMSSNEDDHAEATYKVLRGAANDTGINYERIFISTIILELVLDDDVQDFQLSSDDANFIPFDDVVIEIKRSGQIEEKLAIQLKHQSKELSTKYLTQKRGEFSIKNYFERTKNCKMLENFEKILFTNRKSGNINKTFTLEGESFEIEMTPCNSKLFSDHYRGKGESYKFELSDKKIDENYDRFFDHFFLYASQLNVDQLEEKLRKKFQQVFNCEKSVFLEYLNFITEWSLKKGTRKKLYKNWIKEVIAMHLLSPRVQPISFDTQDNNEKTDIFRRCINNFDITVFEEKDSERIAKLWSINKEFADVDIATVNRLTTKYQIKSNYIEMLDDLNKAESSMVLWLLDKCPLIIRYDKCVTKAIQFMKNKKFVILDDNHGDTDFSNSFYNFKMFQNLSDLKENFLLYDKLVKTFQCSLQGKRKISLEILIGGNQNFEEQITTNDLLLFLNDDFMIGGKKEILPDIYIERHFSRHIIDYEFLSEMNKNSVVIISNLKITNKYFEQFKLINIETLLKQDFKNKDESDSRKVMYFCTYNCNYNEFVTVCNKLTGKSKYHHFRMYNDKLEWICSRGGIEDLKQFQSEGDLVEEKEVYECDNNVVTICGDPGLGKTTSMKYVKNCTHTSFWTVLIFPKDHSKYFREKEQNEKSFEQHIQEEVNQKISEFGFKVFQSFLQNGRVNFVWDGLDEIPDTYLDKVLDVIESFAKKGLKQFITSRNTLRNKLENRFSAFATTIKQFDEKEQKYYIKNRLRCSDEELEILFRKIQNNISLLKYNEIFEIPLQSFMLTELFIQDQEKYSSLLTNTFSLTDLYYHFIHEKFNIFFNKNTNLPNTDYSVKQMKKVFKKDKILSYQHLAMQMYFSEESVNFIDNVRCKEFITEIRKDSDRIGFITEISSDDLPNFIHNTFGEYFTALYLSKIYKDIPNLGQFLFKEKYNNIRFLFDLILAKDCPAHFAVLCKNLNALKACDIQSLTKEDPGGRNPLQLACSYGERYPLLTVSEEIHPSLGKRYIVHEERERRVKKPNLEHQNILRYLSSFCSPDHQDKIYNLTSYCYADETFCFSNLAILSEKHIVNFRNLKNLNLKNVPLVLYYLASLNFSNVTDISTLETIRKVYTQKEDSLLSVAASNGSLDVCKWLIKQGLNVNAIKKKFDTPLHKASRHGHFDIVKLLIDNTAKVDAVGEDDNTPLHIASQNGQVEIVKLLIDNKANVDVVNKYGDTPLHLASANEYVEIVKLLIDNKAHVDIINIDGETLLHLYSAKGDVDIVKLLIENKATVNAVNKYDDTPLHLASGNGHVEIVKLLIDNKAEVNVVNKYGDTPLHIAFRNEDVEIVKLLIDNKANVDVENKFGVTPLHIASENGYLQIVKLLIDKKPKINAVNKYGKTPLHWASESGHVEIVKLLIDNNAKVDAVDEYDDTPLHLASESGYVEIVKLLIDKANVNVENKFGVTPLHVASENGHIEIVKLLIDNKANVDTVKKNDYTPLHIASEGGYVEIVKLLIDKANVNVENKFGVTPLHITSENGYIDIVKLLIDNGAEVNAVNVYGNTPLHIASESGRVETVKLLIDNNAEVDAVNEYDDTPLHLASESGYLQIVKLLIDNKAKVDVVNGNGNTPLHVASKNGYVEIVKLLLNNKANVDLVNKNGYTPQRWASENGYVKIVRLFIANKANVDAVNGNGNTPLHVRLCQLKI